MNKRRITMIGGLALSVVFLWWALRDVSIAELLRHLADANFLLLGAAVAVATTTFALRAMRWKALLYPVLPASRFASRFEAMCIGAMANNLLPARLGEFARLFSLSKMEPIGISAAFGSLVIERLFDALALMIFLVPALWGPGLGANASPLIQKIFIAAAVVVTAGLLLLYLLVRRPSGFFRFVDRWAHRLGPQRLADGITELCASFVSGLGGLRHAHVLLRAVSWSFLIWGWNAVSYWLGFLAFDIDVPGYPGALLLQSMIGFAVSLPSSPGFFGPFEAASRVSLSLYGVDPSRVISFAASYHILTFLPVTLLGLWFAHQLGIKITEVQPGEEPTEVDEASGESPDPIDIRQSDIGKTSEPAGTSSR